MATCFASDKFPAASFDLSRMEASKSGCSNAWAAMGSQGDERKKNAPDAEKMNDMPILWYYYANNYYIYIYMYRMIMPIVWYLTFLSGGCSTSVFQIGAIFAWRIRSLPARNVEKEWKNTAKKFKTFAKWWDQIITKFRS